jgi:hypothetical protein
MMKETRINAQRTHHGLSGSLFEIQRKSGELLPQLHLQAGEVERISDMPWRQSNTIDIYEGRYLDSMKVYIKYLRLMSASEDNLRVGSSLFCIYAISYT